MQVRRDMCYATPLELWDRVLLEPAPVINEALDRHRLCMLETGRALVASEAKRVVRVGDIQGRPPGPEEHPGRHVARPALHRLPEDAHVHPPGSSVPQQRVHTVLRQ
jgi:hypothetical protein